MALRKWFCCFGHEQKQAQLLNFGSTLRYYLRSDFLLLSGTSWLQSSFSLAGMGRGIFLSKIWLFEAYDHGILYVIGRASLSMSCLCCLGVWAFGRCLGMGVS
jgi:hypothetical protein